MAKSRSYKKDEKLLTQILLGETAVFLLYLISAASGWTFLKVTAVIAIIAVSGLGLGVLYLKGELLRLRSRWLVTGFAAILICTLVSLICRYPSPAPLKVENPGTIATETSAVDPSDSTENTTEVGGVQAPTGGVG